MNWVYGKDSTESLIMWLHGGAGAGKSAIAQRIAERCHEADILLASFFASNRADARRMDANYIIPTIAYQIARAIPEAHTRITEEITRDPLIFAQSFEAQMLALVVRPLQPLVMAGFFADPTSSQRLVIVDGLDEISDRGARVKILQVISNALHFHNIPLIFLIASRPEQEISHAFSMEPLSAMTGRLLLDETFRPRDDIQVFLNDSFLEIQKSHPQRNTLPSYWPPWHAVDELVTKASDHFIYASTVVHFVKSPRHRPSDQLDIVLGLRPVLGNSPFSGLDSLYMQILSVQENWDQIKQIIGVLLASPHNNWFSLRTPSDVEEFLGLRTGDLNLYLVDMASLISCDLERGKIPQILHASFSDFLLDPTRSGRFSISKKAMHTMMACHSLQWLIDVPKRKSTDGEFAALFHIILLILKLVFSDSLRYVLDHTDRHIFQGNCDENVLDLLQMVSFQDVLDNYRTRQPNAVIQEIWSLIYRLLDTPSVLVSMQHFIAIYC